jgi:hypothetical protein
MNADELIGQLAVVHPDLTSDPAGRPGQVGIITGTDLENDNVFVGFGRNGQGLYGTDALLLLKPAYQIKQNLEAHKAGLSLEDNKALFQISLIQELHPSAANMKTALSLALQSETVRNLSLRSVEDALGLQRDNYITR